jgi:hypothetical protein
MATTLTYGFILPDTGDLGSVWFPALENNIQQLNDHTHNGTNSSKLQSSAIDAIHETIASGSFSDQGDGYWRATYVLPATVDYDDIQLMFRDPATGDTVHLRVEKIDNDNAYVYTNFVQNFEVYVLT